LLKRRGVAPRSRTALTASSSSRFPLTPTSSASREFAQAGWILPWSQDEARRVSDGRIDSAVESAIYEGRLWAAPFTTNT